MKTAMPSVASVTSVKNHCSPPSLSRTHFAIYEFTDITDLVARSCNDFSLTSLTPLTAGLSLTYAEQEVLNASRR